MPNRYCRSFLIHAAVWAVLGISTHGTVAYGADALCRPLAEAIPPLPALPRKIAGEEVIFASDSAYLQENGEVAVLSGNVVAQHGTQVLSADQVLHRRTSGETEASGHITVWDGNLVVSGSSVHMRQDGSGSVEDGRYWLADYGAHGQAGYVDRESPTQIRLENATYSTCEPGNEAWWLQSSQTTIDLEAEEAESYDLVLRFMDVPIFYLPYATYPISDRRKSGFLPPSIGYSGSAGLDLAIPYYWNIAPNYDATITPRIMTKRGLMLKNEFRYLTDIMIGKSSGQLDLDYMPDDSEYGGNERWLGKIRHTSQFMPGLSANVLFQEVSDIDYLQDFGGSLETINTTHLERNASLRYVGKVFDTQYLLQGKVQNYQTLSLNPALKQYERMPQLLFQTLGRERNRQLNFKINSEYVYFDKSTEGLRTMPVIGSRVHMDAGISYPWREAAGYVTPSLKLQGTAYALENVRSGVDDSPNRALPTFSTDAGLIFERDWQWGETPMLQTLEPRLFYLYTPYENQDNLPIFDTSEYDESMGQLFREDRFSGPDRIGDANQLTVGLTTRLLNSKNGAERLRFSVGQIQYFSDLKVQMPGQRDVTDESSDIITELALQPWKQLGFLHTFRWNPHTEQTNYAGLRVRYQPSPGNVVNLAYRFRDRRYEQTDISTAIALNRNWNLVGMWNYSLKHDKTMDAFAGIEYNTCCWTFRLVGRSYMETQPGGSVLNDDYNNEIYFQVELKGLTSAGKRLTPFFNEYIPGYNDDFQADF